MKKGWYYIAAQNDIALLKQSTNWKDVRKGLGWGAGLGSIPLAIGLLTGPHDQQQKPQSQKSTIKETTPAKPNTPPPALSQPEKIKTPEIATINSAEQISPIEKDNNDDLNKIMEVIHQMESSGGINTQARFEPEFLKNYGNKGLMPTLRKMYGDKAAASSYGPYQVMLLKAWEMGFKISPEELAQKETNRKVAESIVKQYYSKGYSPWQIFKRYNGGDKYANKAIKLYENSK